VFLAESAGCGTETYECILEKRNTHNPLQKERGKNAPQMSSEFMSVITLF